MPDDLGWYVFVGGCGVAQTDTRAGAKALLLQKAKADCQRKIDHAETVARHYRAQLELLNVGGLEQVTPESEALAELEGPA